MTSFMPTLWNSQHTEAESGNWAVRDRETGQMGLLPNRYKVSAIKDDVILEICSITLCQ